MLMSTPSGMLCIVIPISISNPDCNCFDLIIQSSFFPSSRSSKTVSKIVIVIDPTAKAGETLK